MTSFSDSLDCALFFAAPTIPIFGWQGKGKVGNISADVTFAIGLDTMY